MWGSLTVIGGGTLAVAGSYQIRKTVEATGNVFNASAVAADKYKGLVRIATGGAIVLYGMYIFSKCK